MKRPLTTGAALVGLPGSRNGKRRWIAMTLGTLILWAGALFLPGRAAWPGEGTTQKEGGESEEVSGEALVKERCAMCHPMGRVRSAQHTLRGWQATIEKMKLFGLQVTDTQATAVVKHLTTAYPALGEEISKSRLYIPNEHDNTLSVINTGTHAVLRTLPGIPRPHALCRSPDGRFVYVSSHSESGGVQVIDTVSDGVVARIQTAAYHMHCAFSPEGRYVFVASHGANAVQIIDGIVREVIATIPVGQAPHNVVVSQDNRSLWVTNIGSSDLSVIDRSTLKVKATIPVGKAPLGLAMSPDGARVYSANTGSGDVSVIDAAALKVIATVPIGRGVNQVRVSPDGGSLWIAVGAEGAVALMNTVSHQVGTRIPVGQGPHGIAFTPDGKHVYVTNSDSNDVSVIDVAALKVIETIPVGKAPACL